MTIQYEIDRQTQKRNCLDEVHVCYVHKIYSETEKGFRLDSQLLGVPQKSIFLVLKRPWMWCGVCAISGFILSLFYYHVFFYFFFIDWRNSHYYDNHINGYLLRSPEILEVAGVLTHDSFMTISFS